MIKNKVQAFQDTIVIYESREDGCWIAHSLKTDQLGTGDCIVDALVDVMTAVKQVCAAAREDKTIAYLRNAPPEIQELARKARKLPGEIYEIAHLKVRGKWPEDLTIDLTSKRAGESFKAELREEVAC